MFGVRSDECDEHCCVKRIRDVLKKLRNHNQKKTMSRFVFTTDANGEVRMEDWDKQYAKPLQQQVQSVQDRIQYKRIGPPQCHNRQVHCFGQPIRGRGCHNESHEVRHNVCVELQHRNHVVGDHRGVILLHGSY